MKELGRNIFNQITNMFRINLGIKLLTVMRICFLDFSSFRRQIDPKKRRKTEENEEEGFIQFRVCVIFYFIALK